MGLGGNCLEVTKELKNFRRIVITKGAGMAIFSDRVLKTLKIFIMTNMFALGICSRQIRSMQTHGNWKIITFSEANYISGEFPVLVILTPF